MELLAEVFGDSCNYWDSLKLKEKKQIYEALVNRIVIRDGDIQEVELDL